MDAAKGVTRPRVEAVEVGKVVAQGNLLTGTAQQSSPGPRAELFSNLALWPAGDDIVIVLSGCRWNASGGAQRPVAMSRELQQAGFHTIYVGCNQPGIQWAGGILQIDYGLLQAHIGQIMEAKGTIICTLPIPSFVEMCRKMQTHGWKVIYDILDDWSAFHEEGGLANYDPAQEDSLLLRADILTASAQALIDKAQARVNKEITLVPNGGPALPFEPCERPDDMAIGEGGTVVYSGFLSGVWFNWYLLLQTAQDMPSVEFNVIGDPGICNLPTEPNLKFLGSRPYPEAMRYVQYADVGIIPFQADELCAGVDPIKWYDYIAGRCQVVASWPLTDIWDRPYTYICAEGAMTMAREIEEAIAAGKLSQEDATRVLEQSDASWRSRTQKLMATLGVEM